MKHNNTNLKNMLKKPLNSRRSKSILLYKNYIYNLFKYNENKYKKKDNIQNFKAIIKCSDTQIINNNIKKYNTLYTYKNENKKISSVTPYDYKSLNHNRSYNKKKKLFKSRNNTYNKNLTNNYSSLYQLMTISGINNTISNSNDKHLFLRPLSSQRFKTETSKINRENTNKESIKLNKDKKFESKLISTTDRRYSGFIKEKNNNGMNRPIQNINKNKKKVLLFRDVNDMMPRNRFTILRRDLLEENIKINKMIMKFQTQIIKNQLLIKRFEIIKNKGNNS